MIPTLLGVAVLIFFLMRVVPGDLVELRFAGESAFAQKENLDTERARLGLDQRSEEHTSELQSPCNLVCRLLLEKKKKNEIDPYPKNFIEKTTEGTTRHSC